MSSEKKKKKRPGRPRLVYPPLTKEQLALCPNGDNRCRICQLRPDQIQDIHDKRYKEKYSYKEMIKYIRETIGIGEDFTRLSNHFNRHVNAGLAVKRALKKREASQPELLDALEDISTDVQISTSGKLEKAYEQLVKIAQTFVERTNEVQDTIALSIDTRDIATEIKDIPVMELLEKQTKLNKEARECIKEISMLRAPKVMVAQFLESFIDAVIKDLGFLLSNVASELKHDISAELTDAGHPGALSDATFSDVFKRMAMDFRSRMVNLKRQKMADAMATLQDLEKLL